MQSLLSRPEDTDRVTFDELLDSELGAMDGFAERVELDWREDGVVTSGETTRSMPSRGRDLIERALPYQLGAKVYFDLGTGGLQCTISLPVSTSTHEERSSG